MINAPKIYLVHAARISMQPAEGAFAHHWPQARLVSVLDESISQDVGEQGNDGPRMLRRFELLGEYCETAGADAILFTCSAFAEAIGRVKEQRRLPVLTPNEALFERLLSSRGRAVVLVTFQASVAALEHEIWQAAARLGEALPQVEFRLVPGAFGASDHDERIVEACRQLDGTVETIVLGQFSMASAGIAARKYCRTPILDTPSCAVAKLRGILEPSFQVASA